MTTHRIIHSPDGIHLAWRCQVCQRLIPPAPDAGWVWLPARQLRAARESRRAFRAEAAANNGFVSGATLLHAVTARWQVNCTGCDPGDADPSHYHFSVDRIDTAAELIDWTAHLTGKVWFADTDWDQILYDAGRAISEGAAA